MPLTTLEGIQKAAVTDYQLVIASGNLTTNPSVTAAAFHEAWANGTAGGTSRTGGVGSYPASGVAVQIDDSNAGAPRFSPHPRGYWWAKDIHIGGNSPFGQVLLYDRLLQAGADLNTNATVNFSGSTRIPARDINGTDKGEGVMMFLVNSIDSNSTANLRNITVTYTNSEGVAGRTTTFASQQARDGGYLSPGLWIPLQSGDTGVQSVESISTNIAMETFLVCLVLARPLLLTGGPGLPNNTATSQFESLKSFNPLHGPMMPRVWNGSALTLAASLPSVQTNVRPPGYLIKLVAP